jgi:hypothetical protein
MNNATATSKTIIAPTPITNTANQRSSTMRAILAGSVRTRHRSLAGHRCDTAVTRSLPLAAAASTVRRVEMLALRLRGDAMDDAGTKLGIFRKL